MFDKNTLKNKSVPYGIACFRVDSINKKNRSLKMRKKLLCLGMIFMLGMTMTISTMIACEMVAFRGLNNRNLSTQSSEDLYVREMFKYFRELGFSQSSSSNQQERNGFGITFYMNNNVHTSPGRIRTYTGSINSDRRSASYKTNGTNDYQDYYPLLDNILILSQPFMYQDMRIVLAHKRRATSGSAQIPNPHPWVYRDSERSYSFAHNGTLTLSHMDLMSDYLEENNSYIDAEMNNILNVGVDSGLFFTYLLVNIQAANWNIMEGIREAMSKPSLNSSPQHNFILSDGIDIYAYRNSDQHQLHLYHRTDRDIAMISSLNYLSPAVNTLANLFNNSHLTEINNRTLVVIPAYGRPLIFESFATTYNVTFKRWPRNGWNWYSMPVLPDGDNQLSDILTTRYTTASEIETAQGTETKTINGWNFVNIDDFVDEKTGLKININYSGNSPISLIGKIRPITAYDLTLQPGRTYWLTYNLMSSQSFKDAVGEHFAKIQSVQADRWIYTAREPSNPTRELIPYIPELMATYVDKLGRSSMEYGKTYIVTLKHGVDPIVNFQWNDSRIIHPTSFIPGDPRFFIAQEKSDYEAVGILAIDEHPDEVVEIGVFADQTCIGAAAVDEFPVQVLIYSEGYEGMPLTFRALYPSGMVSPINPVVNTMDTRSGEFENKVLIAGQIGHSVALLNNRDSLDTSISALVTNHKVYPNPFNPTTMIDFNISEASPVKIEIFNIKGQVVNTLFNDTLTQGHHYIRWNGDDSSGRSIASGIYFYKISTNHTHAIGRMLLMK